MTIYKPSIKSATPHRLFSCGRRVQRRLCKAIANGGAPAARAMSGIGSSSSTFRGGSSVCPLPPASKRQKLQAPPPPKFTAAPTADPTSNLGKRHHRMDHSTRDENNVPTNKIAAVVHQPPKSPHYSPFRDGFAPSSLAAPDAPAAAHPIPEQHGALEEKPN